MASEEYVKIVDEIEEQMDKIKEYLNDEQGEIKIMQEDVTAMTARITHLIDWKKSKNDETDGHVINDKDGKVIKDKDDKPKS